MAQPLYTPFMTRASGNMANAYMQASDRNRREGKMEERKALLKNAYMGDPAAMQELAGTDPQAAMNMQQMQRQRKADEVSQAGRKRNESIENQQIITGVLKEVAKAGTIEEGQAIADAAIAEYGDVIDTSNFTAMTDEDFAQVKTRFGAKEKPVEYKQGTGKMAGYAFDPTTGQFSIQDGLRAELEASAAEDLGKESLGIKDIKGINDKVTGLTGDATDIKTAAADLLALKDNQSPSSQVAAVFKFMKALDPTSTVRESELGMVYSAEGAAQGIANQINKMMGEGGLSEEGFNDIIRTSEVLANSAIDASAATTAAYLDVIKPNMSPRQYDKMMARVPAIIEIAEPPVAADVSAEMVDNGDGTFTLPDGQVVRRSTGGKRGGR